MKMLNYNDEQINDTNAIMEGASADIIKSKSTRHKVNVIKLLRLCGYSNRAIVNIFNNNNNNKTAKQQEN